MDGWVQSLKTQNLPPGGVVYGSVQASRLLRTSLTKKLKIAANLGLALQIQAKERRNCSKNTSKSIKEQKEIMLGQ
jgi:hypothetical protein